MWKLHRYYAKEVLLGSAISLLVLTAVVTISLVYRGIDRAQGGTLLHALVITVLWTADAFPHLLAIAVLFGTINAFARAAADREITAMRAAGIGLGVPLQATLLVGLAMAGLAGVFVDRVIPWAHYHKFRVVTELVREFLLHSRPAADQLAVEGATMTWQRETDGHYHDVVVFHGKEVLVADEAWIEISGAGWVSIELRGARSPLSGAAIEAPTLHKHLDDMGFLQARPENEDDVVSEQLIAELHRGVAPNPGRAAYIVHRRHCYALLPCLMMPLGLCIGVLSRARGRAAAMSFGLVPVGLFYAGDFLGQGIVRTAGPELGAWAAYLPVAILVVLGTPFCWRTLRS